MSHRTGCGKIRSETHTAPSASVMPGTCESRGFGFPNARREEVDRLRVAMVFLHLRAWEMDRHPVCLPCLWDMLVIVGCRTLRRDALTGLSCLGWRFVGFCRNHVVSSILHSPGGRSLAGLLARPRQMGAGWTLLLVGSFVV